MQSRRERVVYDESGLTVSPPEDHAAGPTAVAVSLERMGPVRAARTLLALNQAEEASRDRATPAFFAGRSHKSGPRPTDVS